MKLNDFFEKHPSIKVSEVAKLMYGKSTSAQMLNQKLKEYQGKTGKQRITENDIKLAKEAIKKISNNMLSDVDQLTID